MDRPRTFDYLATAAETATFPAGSCLHGILVGTAAASAVVTVYHGQTTSGPVIALIDAAAAKDTHFHGLRCPDGIHVVLSGGNAKVTVIAG